MNISNRNTTPNWEIKSLDNKPTPSIYSFQGRPLLILFFNLGCIGCRGRAIPYSIRFAELYPNLQVVGIHTNFEGVHYLPGQIASFIDKANVPYPVFQDDGKKTYQLFQAEGTPHWILLNREGLKLKSIFGSMGNAIHRLDYGLMEIFQKKPV